MFPWIGTGQDLSATSLVAYKWRPDLENHHVQLKGTHLVAPVFPHQTARIEGPLRYNFIAIMIQTRIERQTRTATVLPTAGAIQCLPVIAPAGRARRFVVKMQRPVSPRYE